MFKKREDVIEEIDSLIGENIKIIGNIEGKGNIRIDGIVEGDINYDGNVVIGQTGHVIGNITTDDVSLAGNVKGNITSKTKLVILETGSLMGDLQVPSFIVHENATFDGNCKMIKEESGNPIPGDKPKSKEKENYKNNSKKSNK